MQLLRNLTQYLIFWLSKVREQRDHGLSDFDKIRAELKPCDVLLIQGRSLADRKIQAVSQSVWSHSSLYIGRLVDIQDPDLKTIIEHFHAGSSTTPLVVESCLGKGITLRPLSDYEHEHTRLCRPKSLRDKDAEQVIRFAINRLGTHSGTGHFFDLMRFIFPWSLLPASWRRSAFRKWAGRHTVNSSADFIAECFGFIQFPIFPLVRTNDDQGVRLYRRPPRLCLPCDIDMSPNFEIIKYPFIDFKLYANEQLIPWKGSGVYSGVDQDPALGYSPQGKENNVSVFPKND